MCVHYSYFFVNDTATTEIYTLSLHDALPISPCGAPQTHPQARSRVATQPGTPPPPAAIRLAACNQRHPDLHTRAIAGRSEEHTSELQSRQYLVCRLLLEKKKHTTR